MAIKLVAVGFLAGVPATLAQPGWGPGWNTLVNDPEHIKQLNSVENSTWNAGPNAFFNNLTLNDARALLGTRLSHISNHLHTVLDESSYESISPEKIPRAFDATKRWPGLLHPVPAQQDCGSCWAVSASSVLSDRVAIATGKTSPPLSPQDMVSCDKSNFGCNGGTLEDAWEYLQSTGIVTDTCFPYTSGPGTVPACPNKCLNPSPFPWPYPWRAPEHWNQSKVTVSSAYAINGVTNMKREIMTNGPIQVGFVVCPDFFSYKSGIYQLDETQYPVSFQPFICGGHAVKMVGWGAENTGGPHNTPYWRLANSWNATWGEHGYFRILRGKDNAGVETMGPPYAGMPAVSTSESLLVV